MSILTSIESGFECLYTRQNELDELFYKINLSLDERYKMDKLKREISDILTDILALQSEDILSSSFYLQVNEIEQELYNILEERKAKLNKLVEYKNKLRLITEDAFKTLYYIETLEKCFHINVQSEIYFLDIKNNLKTKNICDKKILALKFLKEKLESYKNGIVDIILIANKNLLKEELSFERKQEIFRIFSSISLKSQRVKNHTKVFNEEIKNMDDDIYTLEYLKWFEELFLEMCKYVNLEVDPYYLKIRDTLCSNTTNIENVNSMADYIYNRYKNEIELYLNKVEKISNKVERNVKRQLSKCLSFDVNVDFVHLYETLKNNKKLPEILKDSDYSESYENLLFGLDIETKIEGSIDYVLEDIKDKICDLFDEEKYLEMYKYNSTVKSKEVANYRQYYLSLIEEAKKELKKQYINELEDKLSKAEIKPYTTSILLKKINLIEEDINLIKEALKYINKNYRDFSKANLKIYIDSIQKRYEINNLYDNILAKKSNLVYKLMAKSKLVEETKHLYEFVNKKEIKEKLQKEIIDKIFLDEEELKQELISNL